MAEGGSNGDSWCKGEKPEEEKGPKSREEPEVMSPLKVLKSTTPAEGAKKAMLFDPPISKSEMMKVDPSAVI